jgi:6-phosphogluconate dehydrogenase
MVDLIQDKAGQKGTGKWTVMNGLELGSGVTLIAEAVFARCISSQKDERVSTSKILAGPKVEAFTGDKAVRPCPSLLARVRGVLSCASLTTFCRPS